MPILSESYPLLKNRDQINIEVGIDMLEKTKKIFDEYNIEFWLDAGTLLGYMRQGGFIEGDYDIDLCVQANDVDKVDEALKKLPYYFFLLPKNPCFRIFYKNMRMGITLVEFDELGFFYDRYLYPMHKIGEFFDYIIWILNLHPAKYKETNIPTKLSDVFIKLASITPFRKKILKIVEILYEKLDSYYMVHAIPSRLYTPRETVKFYGMDVKIPVNTEEYLVYRYGKNWKIPQPDYKYCKFLNNGKQLCEDGTIVWKNKEKPPENLMISCLDS